jgi:hypothetical protein
MFSSAAHGSHVFCLTTATTTAPNEAEDDSTTAVDPPASSFLPAASSFLSTTAMDVDAIAKHPHSPVISESDRVSSLAVPTASSASEITSITIPLLTSEQPAKKRSRGSRQSAVSGSAKDIVFSAGKATPASAVIWMQGSINRLTDIFEKSMMSHIAEDPATASRNHAMTLVQEYDDDLTVDEKIALVSYFAKDLVAANTYISLTDHEV